MSNEQQYGPMSDGNFRCVLGIGAHELTNRDRVTERPNE